MNVDLFFHTLPYMLQGMIGIFAVTLVIMLCIWLLNRLTPFCKKGGELD